MPYLKHSSEDPDTDHKAEPIAQYGQNRASIIEDRTAQNASRTSAVGPQFTGYTAENGTNEINQLVLAMVATSQRLPDFGLIKAEIAADRREAEVAEKTDLLKERNRILEDVRPFIDLMKKERPDESEY